VSGCFTVNFTIVKLLRFRKFALRQLFLLGGLENFTVADTGSALRDGGQNGQASTSKKNSPLLITIHNYCYISVVDTVNFIIL